MTDFNQVDLDESDLDEEEVIIFEREVAEMLAESWRERARDMNQQKS